MRSGVAGCLQSQNFVIQRREFVPCSPVADPYQMDVAVDQAGKDRLVAIIHLLHACALGSGDSFLGADLSNRVAFEEDCRSFLDRSS